MNSSAGWALEGLSRLLGQLAAMGLVAVVKDTEGWHMLAPVISSRPLPPPAAAELEGLAEGQPTFLEADRFPSLSSLLAGLGWPQAWLTRWSVAHQSYASIARRRLAPEELEGSRAVTMGAAAHWRELQIRIVSALAASLKWLNQVAVPGLEFRDLVTDATARFCLEMGLQPYIEWFESPNFRLEPGFGVALPVYRHGQEVGWLRVDVGIRDVGLTEAILSLIGACEATLERTGLMRELEDRNRSLSALVEVDNALVGFESFEELSTRVSHVLAEVLNASTVGFRPIISGRPLPVVDATSGGQRLEVPVVVRGRLAAKISIEKAPGLAFSRHDIALCQVVAGRMAAALERDTLFRQVARGKREWEQTFDAIGDPIFLLDEQGTIIRANRSFANLYGLPPQKAVGRSVPDLCRLHGCLAGRLGGDHSQEGQCLFALKLANLPSGQTEELSLGTRFFEVSRYPLDLQDGQTGWVAIMQDVTEQRALQEAVIRAEKLRVLGELASGIAHDFNNLLSTVLGRTEMLLLSSIDGTLKEEVRSIQQAALDGREIVKRIQEYTRIRRDSQFWPVDVNDCVQVAVDLAKPRWRDAAYAKGIRIDVHLDLRPVPPVMGSASDLREVIVNLIFNAIDAMPSGGDLYLATWSDGRMVNVAVRDTGVGMTEDTKRRVFDPFFTTKGPSGSGLGLSIAWGIVTRHGGEIRVESQPKKGSTFTVVLPAVPEASLGARQTVASPIPSPKRILLVDENLAVAGTTAGLLAKAGHEVTVTYSGHDALRRLSTGDFDLVISDLGMPEMDGWEVARAVKALRPWVPVILATGWAFEIDEGQAADQGVDAVLRKPFSLEEILSVIASVTEVPRVPPVSTGRHVLVVDDEASVAEPLAALLKLEGLEPRVVHGFHEALVTLAQYVPDVAFVDLVLADGDGTELARHIKERSPHCKVVMMSGYAVAMDDPHFLSGPVDHVLPKPWSLGELEGLLQAVFGRGARRGGGPTPRTRMGEA